MATCRRVTTMAGALAAFAASGALAAPIFTAAPEGDWFDGASWNGGVAPVAADAPVVDNGGTAIASSSSPLYPGAGTAIGVQSLAVGSRLDPARPADASGGVELTDLDLSLVGNLSVGVVALDPGNTASAVSGSLSVAAGSQASGDVSAAVTRVGVVTTGPTASSPSQGPDGSVAIGTLEVGGDLEARERVQVGTASLPGSASGQAVIDGELRLLSVPLNSTRPSGSVAVGAASQVGAEAPPTPTMGSLSIAGDLRFVHEGTDSQKATALTVGAATGAHAEGRVDIGGDVIGFRAVRVGVASLVLVNNEATAFGELHVAGRLDEGFSFIGASNPPLLTVGRTDIPGLFAGDFPEGASAEGYATIGEIEFRNLEVGLSGSGPATGVLEIATGDARDAVVGIAGSNAEARGTLVTGGSLRGVLVGISGGGYGGYGEPSLPVTIGTAVGSVVAAGSVGGASVGVSGSNGTARGYLEAESLIGDGTVLVGYSEFGTGSAEGQMIVRSGGMDANYVTVGALAHPLSFSGLIAAGTVNGTLETTGDVSGSIIPLLGDFVGYANPYATGHADGTWILHDGTYTGRKLMVGVTEGAGTATGLIHLDRVLVDVDDITLGDGATVELEIAGLLRGSEYSAFDANVMRLNGALDVAFVAPAQVGVYDLIVSSTPDGITGDFDAVSITGLAADQSAFWGIETVGDATPVEIFRLHVVPEPATGALLAIGLLGIVIRCRRGWGSPL